MSDEFEYITTLISSTYSKVLALISASPQVALGGLAAEFA
jgi:hypothetical protein